MVEWAARLPDRFKVRGRSGKYLLEKAFASALPESVLSHGKQGFGIPVSAWFRGPLYAWAREMLLSEGAPIHRWFESAALGKLLEEHRSARFDHGKRLYALIMLGIWMQQ
jgi:asparagine synthase (glutamine-hydrolysing)